MSKQKSLSRKEFVKKLERLGLEGPFQGGKHQFMCREDIQITIPNKHGKKDIPAFIVQQTITQLGMSRDDWIRA